MPGLLPGRVPGRVPGLLPWLRATLALARGRPRAQSRRSAAVGQNRDMGWVWEVTHCEPLAAVEKDGQTLKGRAAAPRSGCC